MKFLRRIALPLAALLLVAGAKKPTYAVRFFVETNPNDSLTFAQPLKLLNSTKQIYVSNTSVASEHDIVGIYPVPAEDGTQGCAFKLGNEGRLSLEIASGQRRGMMLVVLVGGRHVADLLIDQRISDGIIFVRNGFTAQEIAMLSKQFPVLGPKTKKKKEKEPKLESDSASKLQ